MAELQIRESALRVAREDILALVTDGRLSWETLDARLDPGDISLLHEMDPSVNWYPVATCDRLLTTLMDVEGDGSSDYLVERGKKSVLSFTAANLELRIEEARRNRESGDSWWVGVGPSLVVLPSAIYTHSNWVLVPGEDLGRFTLEVTDAGGFPESLRHSVQGALECLATRLVGASVRVSSGRPSPDRIVFRGFPV